MKTLKMWNLFKPISDEQLEDESIDKIEIFNFSTALETLKLFGNLIGKLQLNLSNADSNEAKTISRYVNHYCTERLVDLKLTVGSGNPLKYWEQPMESVKHLYLSATPMSQGRNIPKLNDTFPRLRTLSVYLSEKSCDYFDCHFQYLDHLIIHEHRSNVHDSSISNLLATNPHIRSVTVHKGRISLLNQINEALPLLKTLTIESYHYHAVEVFFNALEKLVLKNSLEVPKFFLAPNLRELDMAFSSEYSNAWKQFLKVHKNLKRFHLSYSFIYHDEFTMLTENLQNLEEMSVSRYQTAYLGVKWTFPAVNTTIHFLESHKQLKRFDTDLCTESDKQILRTELQDKWQITDHGEGLSFRPIQTHN